MNKFLLMISMTTIATSYSTFSMDIDYHRTRNQEQGKSIVRHISTSASIGTIVGGWGFFTVNSKMITKKGIPYAANRAPLALFLASCTMNQGINILNAQANRDDYIETIGRIYNNSKSE